MDDIESVRAKLAELRNTPHLVMLDPSKGYVAGNVQVVSHHAALLIEEYSIEELQGILEWRLKHETVGSA